MNWETKDNQPELSCAVKPRHLSQVIASSGFLLEGIMGVMIDLSGQRFGRLKVLKKAENKGREFRWLCKCDCGEIRIVHRAALRRGYTKSCGCLHKEIVSKGMMEDGRMNNLRQNKRKEST